MHDDETNVRTNIRYWVWSGFYDAEAAAERLDGLFEDDPDLSVDNDEMHDTLIAEFAKKSAAEATWPMETDCDRLDRVFDALNAGGICALQNAGYTQQDGLSDVAETLEYEGRDKFRGYCFYHGQDLERVIDGHGLLLAFGGLEEDETKSVAIANAIIEALKHERFITEWDGTANMRIDITNIDWKRRTPRVPS